MNRTEARETALRRAGHRCEARLTLPAVQCWGQLCCHEPLTRARGGSVTDPDNIVVLCAAHHDWVHTHPAEAHGLGLLVNSWEAK